MIHTHILLSFCLLLSMPILFLLAPQILPPHNQPISIPDELDDLSLFRRALASSTGSFSSPSTTTPKIALLFLTNSDLWFEPLWNRFFHGHKGKYNIYIHADPATPLSPLTGVFQNRLIAAKPTERASPTLISATRRLLASALLDDSSNAFFALLSQYCIPLHSFQFVYRALFAQMPPPPRTPTKSRLLSFIEILSDAPGLWERYTARGSPNIMLPEVPFSNFRGGSQFFILTRFHATLVVRDRRLWRKFRLPCRNAHSCYPEEHYFPTLLSMEDPDGCSKYTLTNVNWTGSRNGHPHTYHSAEISPALVAQLRVSNSTYSYLFARKFSPSCLPSLMEIADAVIFWD